MLGSLYNARVDAAAIQDLLEKLSAGSLSVEEAVVQLRDLPFEKLGDIARVDHHRELRLGTPEIVYGEGKSAEQIATIMESLNRNGAGALASRVSPDKAEALKTLLPLGVYNDLARSLVIAPKHPRTAGLGTVGVVCAGTSDLAVAEEASICLEFLGQKVERVTDVGVSGLHRLLGVVPRLNACQVLIVDRKSVV